MLNAQDKEALEIFAFNRLRVRRFDDALCLYKLLEQSDEKKTQQPKWQLAQLWCLYQLGNIQQAHQQLNVCASARLSKQEQRFFSSLKDLLSAVSPSPSPSPAPTPQS